VANPDHQPAPKEQEQTRSFNDVYVHAFIGETIVVSPADNPTGPSQEHIDALAAAQRRIGHLTRAFRNGEDLKR
jgi:hypothetical protein